MVRALTRTGCLYVLFLASGTSYGAEAPDGTAFEHPVLSVDGPTILRIKFCGLPVKIQLANVQLRGEFSEKQSENFLKETLGGGAKVTLVMEQGQEGDSQKLPQAHVFKAGQHLNLELVKRGLALSDGGSAKYSGAMQTAQLDAMSKHAGLWSKTAQSAQAASTASPAPHPVQSTASTREEPAQELAPSGYNGAVVADLQGREYHLPGSRYAKSIRAGARIEYPSPEAAERAGKVPSPYSFPDRAQAAQTKLAAAKGGMSRTDQVQEAKTALQEALNHMQQARRAQGTNAKEANSNWKQAAKILAESIDRITPLADANPNDNEIQKLTEEMSMNLYSCNKYQSL